MSRCVPLTPLVLIAFWLAARRVAADAWPSLVAGLIKQVKLDAHWSRAWESNKITTGFLSFFLSFWKWGWLAITLGDRKIILYLEEIYNLIARSTSFKHYHKTGKYCQWSKIEITAHKVIVLSIVVNLVVTDLLHAIVETGFLEFQVLDDKDSQGW